MQRAVTTDDHQQVIMAEQALRGGRCSLLAGCSCCLLAAYCSAQPGRTDAWSIEVRRPGASAVSRPAGGEQQSPGAESDVCLRAPV